MHISRHCDTSGDQFIWIFVIGSVGIQPGLRVGTRRDGSRRLAVANRTRLDLRAYRLNSRGQFGFHLRPRNETVVKVLVKPWFQTSLQAEALIQPDLGLVDMLQLRSGLILHGHIGLGPRRPVRPETQGRGFRRNRPTLSWVVGAQVGFSPVAIVTADAQLQDVAIPVARIGAGEAAAASEVSPVSDPANHVDMVFTLGLSGVF